MTWAHGRRAGDDPRTIPQVLDRIADQFSEHDALVAVRAGGAGSRRLTFAELRDEVRRAAAAMIDLGVGAGDRVAIWSPNTWHWVVACLATTYAGGVLVPLNTRYTASEASRHPGAHRRTAVVRIRRVPRRRQGRFDRPRHPAGTAAHRPGADREGRRNLGRVHRAAAPISMRSTPARPRCSPTTSPTSCSRPAPPAAARARCARIGSRWPARRHGRSAAQITSDDRYLCINPFFHNFGYKAGILACLQTGATLIPQLTFDPEQAMRAVADHRITVLPGPPTIYQTLLDHPKRGDYDLSSLRFAVTGAAVVPVVLIERMQTELDIDIVLTAYGLTEANGFGTMCRPTTTPSPSPPPAAARSRTSSCASTTPPTTARARCCCAGRT